jgi:glutathione S-transferase
VHKAIGPLFNPTLVGEARAAAVETVFKKLSLLEERAGKQSFLVVPDAATIADYLLFPMLGWLGGYLKVRVRLARPATRDGKRGARLHALCSASVPHRFFPPRSTQIEGWEAKLPHLTAWKVRVAALPEVAKVLAAEGALAQH